MKVKRWKKVRRERERKGSEKRRLREGKSDSFIFMTR